jgi:hypothetical protein
MSWQLFEGTSQEWDDIIIRLGATTPFQLSSWAEFRESFGWRSFRLTDTDHSQAVQMLVKTIGALRVAWAPGAPLGAVSVTDLANLVRDAGRFLGGTLTYLRLGDHQPENPDRTDLFRQAGWEKCSMSIGGAHTLVRTLGQVSVSVHDSYSNNWSRNLRRGVQRGITTDVWDAPDADQVAHLHREVEELKKSFGAEWRGDSAAIKRLLASFGDKLVMIKAESAEGQLLAIRAAVVIGTNGFDFLAATSPNGRKCYASNVALNALLSALATRGVRRYDFGGVDRTHNKGVYDFKHGAGGTDHAYNGEFEIAVPRFAKPFISKLVSFRLSA